MSEQEDPLKRIERVAEMVFVRLVIERESRDGLAPNDRLLDTAFEAAVDFDEAYRSFAKARLSIGS